MLDEIQNIPSAARQFIEPVWHHWHQSRGRTVPNPSSRYTCGRTSLFLRDVMRHEGHCAEWMSGTPYAGGSGAPDTACGFYSGTRWEGHAWVISGDIIIDITADQFGGDPVLITSVSDTRYADSIDLADPDAIKARREAVAALWPDWIAFRSNPIRRTIPEFRDKIGGAENSEKNLSRNSLAKVKVSRLTFAKNCDTNGKAAVAGCKDTCGRATKL